MPTPQQRRVVVLGWLSRILGMVISLAMIRVALRLLGEHQFAVFQVLTAALAWLSLSSMGLGPALKNLVSERRARGEPDLALREASSALLTTLFVIVSALLLAGARPATAILLRKLGHDPLWSSRAFFVGGMLSLVVALGQVSTEVLYAEFRALWVYALSIVSSLLTLAMLLVLSRLSDPPPETLVWVVCATLGPPAITGIITLRMTGLLRFRFTLPDWRASSWLIRLSLRFWLFAILSSLVLMVDYLVISQILVAREIVLYSVMMRITTIGMVFFTTVIAVVWPEWTHHWELRRWDELRSSVTSLALASAALCVPGAIAAVALLPTAIRWWLHDPNVVPSTLLILEFVAYLAVRFWTDMHSSALMAGNRVVAATMFAVIQALITAPLELLFGHWWGAEGVIFGLLVGFLATAAWMFPRRFRRELRFGVMEDEAVTC